MLNESITTSSVQTKKLGKMLAEKLRGGEIICLTGDLGAGKTTFSQGLLSGLKIKGPYTSPTFAIVKHYKKQVTRNKKQEKFMSHVACRMSQDIYHIDAYRVSAKDILDLGWKDFAGKKDSIVIVEWAERIKKIIPTNAVWIKFEWINDKERKISLGKR